MSEERPWYSKQYASPLFYKNATTTGQSAIEPNLLDLALQIQSQFANNQSFFKDDLESIDFDSFIDTFDRDNLSPSPESREQLLSSKKHAGVQAIEKHQDTSPAYFSNKGIFTEDEKAFVHQFRHETPSSVLERLKERNPAMTYNYRQVKGAVENERRKTNRREQNGPWTRQEIHFIAQNIALPPKAMLCLLKDSFPGFAKNVDQIRDMKSQIVQKTKGRVRRH